MNDIRPPRPSHPEFIVETPQNNNSPFRIMLAGVLMFALGYGVGGGSLSAATGVPILGSAPAREDIDMGEFWKAWNVLEKKYGGEITTASEQERVWGAIKGLAASYGDPYTTFLTPKEMKAFSQNISGTFSGVGMEVSEEEGMLTVISPLKDSPAERAGIRPKDVILKIDDTSTEGMSVDEAVNLIRGKKGTTVRVTVWREGAGGMVMIPIVRGDIAIPTIDTVQLTPKVMYSRLYTFTETSPQLISTMLKSYKASGSTALILDLRSNPGGFLEAAVDIASNFLPQGAVIVKEDYREDSKDEVLRSKGYGTFPQNHKLIILVDGGSASASEILAGALKEHNRATLVGSTTFGKGSVQELVPVTRDSSLKITVARWLTPKNHSLMKEGITPDIVVEKQKTSIPEASVATGTPTTARSLYSTDVTTLKKDPVVTRALELIENGK